MPSGWCSKEVFMSGLPKRTCPICDSKFTAQRLTSLTCGPVCSQKAKKLRGAIKAFNAGKRDLRPATLEQAMRLLEADEIISAMRWTTLPKISAGAMLTRAGRLSSASGCLIGERRSAA
jgi:hypothetical protein